MWQTRVLVTHGLQYLPEVDEIFVVHEGTISERGTYQELLNDGERFAKFLEEYANSKNEDSDESESEEGWFSVGISGQHELVSRNWLSSSSESK